MTSTHPTRNLSWALIKKKSWNIFLPVSLHCILASNWAGVVLSALICKQWLRIAVFSWLKWRNKIRGLCLKQWVPFHPIITHFCYGDECNHLWRDFFRNVYQIITLTIFSKLNKRPSCDINLNIGSIIIETWKYHHPFNNLTRQLHNSFVACCCHPAAQTAPQADNHNVATPWALYKR